MIKLCFNLIALFLQVFSHFLDDCLPDTCRNSKGVDCDLYSESQCDTDQYVRLHCRLKCATCLSGKVLCYDQSVKCCQWAKAGKCSDATFLEMCPESCGRCGNPARKLQLSFYMKASL